MTNKIERQLTIGLQIVSLSDSYNMALVNAINTLAKKLNVNIILFVGGNPGNPAYKYEHQQRVIFDLINKDNIDAIITLTPSLKNYLTEKEFIAVINKFSSIPIISLGLDISAYSDNQSSIVVDSVSGFGELIEYLITEQKHTKLAFITGPLTNPEAKSRFKTYKKILNKHKLKINEGLIYYGSFTSVDAIPAINQFLLNTDTNNKPDVIICSNDLCAISVIKELKKRNIRIPEDIAVTGFDNIEGSKTTHPSLSTVSQSFFEMGVFALKLAINHVLAIPCKPVYIVNTNFIKRQSSETHKSLDYYQLMDSNNNVNSLDPINEITKSLDSTNEITKSLDPINEQILPLNYLLKIIFKIFLKIDQTNRWLIDLEDNYIQLISKRIKNDLRNNVNYNDWLSAICQLEEIEEKDIKHHMFIELFTISIRGILDKEYAKMLDADIDSNDNMFFVKDIIEEVTDVENVEELYTKIMKKHSQISNYMDLSNYLILAYPKAIKKDKKSKWTEPKKIDVILSFHDIEQENLNYLKGLDAKYVFPKELKPNKDRYTVVVEALYNSDNQLGRVIYELYPSEMSLFCCAMITKQIASTLRIIHQNNEYDLAKNKIKALSKDLELRKQAEQIVLSKCHQLATMGHEIRVPLNEVLGITDFFKNTNLDEK
ncbi:MAG: substrate-binding domain-containing protein [Saccharospirillaceae bacterium]|nr:substrate-binding domain-containing protein [Pseudomonadales bacterium]NRB79678.1 substrate-binding domain-containing protein [Saccharospirillaceae bacterium]